ncbi:hypothetical protein LINGRAHAP2_LOCUS10282 [Linum grandiflorum]
MAEEDSVYEMISRTGLLSCEDPSLQLSRSLSIKHLVARKSLVGHFISDRDCSAMTMKHNAQCLWRLHGDLQFSKPDDVEINSTIFWVRLMGLPQDMRVASNFVLVAHLFKSLLDVDEDGLSVDQWRPFVRLKMEVFVDKPLPTGFRGPNRGGRVGRRVGLSSVSSSDDSSHSAGVDSGRREDFGSSPTSPSLSSVDFGFDHRPASDPLHATSDGQSGGLALWWVRDVNIQVLGRTTNFIHTRWGPPDDCFVTFVYGAPRLCDRQSVWDVISSLNSNSSIPWALIGDFNAVRLAEEKEGCLPPSASSLKQFNNFIFGNGLEDVSAVGPLFTWSNNYQGAGLVRQRLDRLLCNVDWREKFPKAFVSHLPMIQSDHCPIILRMEPALVYHRHRFMYENGWREAFRLGYDDVVQVGWWTPGVDTSSNLLNCARNLTSWKNHSIGATQLRIDDCMARLQFLGQQTLSSDIELQIQQTKIRLGEYLRIQESYWSQRVHQGWLRLGDSNTCFFHLSTVQQRRRNRITTLKVDDGTWVEDHGEYDVQQADYGVILFNSSGIAIDGRAGRLVCKEPLVAEAWALLVAARLAASLVGSINILSDYKPLLNVVVSPPEFWTWACASLLASVADVL